MMNRAIVLLVCLSAAGAVAGYTHYSQEADEQTPVFTVHVPHRTADPVQPKVLSAQLPAGAIPKDRASLTRELQRELKRVGCYSGDINGVWTTSSRMAMKSFTDRVNATLPIDYPDQILLSLVQGHQNEACSAHCAPDEAAAESGRCLARAPSAQAKAGAEAESKIEPRAEQSPVMTGSVVPATATAAAALAATAAVPKAAPKIGRSDDPPRSAAAAPDDAQPGRSERATRHGGPLPSERVYKRRARRHSNGPRPPKFVRSILRTFGIR